MAAISDLWMYVLKIGFEGKCRMLVLKLHNSNAGPSATYFMTNIFKGKKTPSTSNAAGRAFKMIGYFCPNRPISPIT